VFTLIYEEEAFVLNHNGFFEISRGALAGNFYKGPVKGCSWAKTSLQTNTFKCKGSHFFVIGINDDMLNPVFIDQVDKADCNRNQDNNAVTIAVCDFGIGIAQDDQVKLFQKFPRILNLQENRISGTGLGLSITMEIVKEHGSTINLYSEVGKGSVFSFDLPLLPVN